MRKELYYTGKGGSGKTTSAALRAIEAAKRPSRKRPGDKQRVLAVDIDTKSQGLADWFNQAHLGGGLHGHAVHCVAWSHQAGLIVPFIHDQIQRLGGPDQIDLLVVDSGGEDPENSKHAARMCDLAIIPVAPTRLDLRRAEATKAVLEGTGIAYAVLLRAVDDPGKGRAARARAALEEYKFAVLDTEIPNNRALYADVAGTIPETTGAYKELTDELEGIQL